MFVRITNTPRDYAWGSTTAIPELLGTPITGEPEAELWLGAHAGSPSRILDPSLTGGAQTLEEWIAADPSATLGNFAGGGRLPFLLKVLAAAHPLSLQAHPTPEQARAGFERDNAAGVPLDAPNRNYKDAFPKPELIYALSERFDALCGFRPLEETRALLKELLELDAQTASPQPEPIRELLGRLETDASLEPVFEWLISRGAGVPALVDRVTELAALGTGGSGLATVRTLAAEYPGDPGIVISLLLHRVTLKRGEALYLPAGNIHAYLDGLGVELMAASDNVLRGGLTPKHIDVPELLGVLRFEPLPVPYLRPATPVDGVEVFRPDVPDFVLVRITASASYRVDGPAIALCTAGSVTISGAVSGPASDAIAASGAITLTRGQAAYITPDEAQLRFAGAGELFLATTGE